MKDTTLLSDSGFIFYGLIGGNISWIDLPIILVCELTLKPLRMERGFLNVILKGCPP